MGNGKILPDLSGLTLERWLELKGRIARSAEDAQFWIQLRARAGQRTAAPPKDSAPPDAGQDACRTRQADGH